MDTLDQLRLNRPERRLGLVQEFYEKHHRLNRDISQAKDDLKKVSFFNESLSASASGRKDERLVGIDLGCRGGALTRQLCQQIKWSGADIDRNAIALAIQNGIPCCEMEITTAIDFKDRSFDVVILTEVLEHLPYPDISVTEIARILKPGGLFCGSVPLDYHFHRRWSVMRGGRLTGDPTHLHHFSFGELDGLLLKYFRKVVYQPLRGTVARHPNWKLSWHHFIRDIAWVATDPR
jgi:SAM-dependent methyltransferase